MTATNAHIVAIRRDGVVEGHQLRINGGGPGLSKFFSTGKHGSAEKALRAAKRVAKDMGLPKTKERGGSEQGRVPSGSATKAAGIRFEWTIDSSTPILRVVATWTDRRKKGRNTSYSVERNGLGGALDKAIAARTSCGAPVPSRDALMRLLRREYRNKAAMAA